MAEKAPHVEPWKVITGPLAWCSHCGWSYPGDTDPDARTAIRRATRHTRDTGHGTIIERGQSRRVMPDAS